MLKTIKNLIIKLKNRTLKMGKNSNVKHGSQFEGNNVIGANTNFSGTLGKCSYIGAFSSINANVGRYCSIASYVQTVSGTHPTKEWVSTHPAFFSTQKQCGISFVDENKFCETTVIPKIGNDVWIGNGAMIVGSVNIGDGAIIGAGAVVVKDVPPYSIVCGVPAKILRYRFEKSEIEFLLEFKWWNKDEKWIKNNAKYFGNFKTFKENCLGDNK